MKVRRMYADDVCKGFLQTMAALGPAGLSAGDALRVFRSRADNPHAFTLVAVEAGQVVGTATLLLEPKFGRGGRWCGRVEDVAVRRAWQGRGVGRALLEAALERAREWRCRKVVLECADDNVGFYEKLGFQRHENGMRLDL